MVWTHKKNARRKNTQKSLGTVSTWEKRKGRPRNTWMQEIMTGMKTKGLEEEDWNDRDEWRRKIKLEAQKDV